MGTARAARAIAGNQKCTPAAGGVAYTTDPKGGRRFRWALIVQTRLKGVAKFTVRPMIRIYQPKAKEIPPSISDALVTSTSPR